MSEHYNVKIGFLKTKINVIKTATFVMQMFFISLRKQKKEENRMLLNIFRFGLLAKSLQLCMTVSDDDDDDADHV